MLPHERLILTAARGDRAAAASAWSAWLAGHDLEQVDPGTFAGLAAVSRNLDRHQVEHREAARLRGIFKYAWSQGQLTVRDLRTLQPALAAARLHAVSIRGLPVTARYLGELAALPVDQLDFLLAPESLEAAAGILERLGWRATGRVPPARVRWVYSLLAFEAPGRRRVVLHWRVLPLGSPRAFERALAGRAAPFPIEGTECLVLDPVDQFLVLAARLPSLAPVERVRWALEADAVLEVLQASGRSGELDQRAAEAEVSGLVRQALAWLRSDESAEIPAGIAPIGALARVTRALTGSWRSYQAVCRATGSRPSPGDYLGFTAERYRHDWGVPRIAALPGAALRRLGTPAAPGRG